MYDINLCKSIAGIKNIKQKRYFTFIGWALPVGIGVVFLKSKVF